MESLSSNQNVGHGHVFPRPDGSRARCGGPSFCNVCAIDLGRKNAQESVAAAEQRPSKELTLDDVPPQYMGDAAWAWLAGYHAAAEEIESLQERVNDLLAQLAEKIIGDGSDAPQFFTDPDGAIDFQPVSAHEPPVSQQLQPLFLSSEVERLRKALRDLKEGITHNATDTVWYSGIQTACDRIDEILVGGQGVTASSQPPPDEYELPCDVRLPPNTFIGKGCKLSTLMSALKLREGQRLEFSEKPLPTPPPAAECLHLEIVDLEDSHARWCTECGAFHDGTQWIHSRTAALLPGLEVPILRNCLGNLFAAVQRFGPVDADIGFAMGEAARALGPPYSTSTKEVRYD